MTASATHQPSDARTALEARLGALHAVLVRLEQLTAQAQAVYNEHQHRFVQHKPYWGARKYWLLVFLIGTSVFFIATTFVFPMVARASVDSGSDDPTGMVVGVIVFTLLPIPISLVGAGIWRKRRNAKIPAHNADVDRRNDEIAQHIAHETWPVIGPIEAELERTRQDFRARFTGFFPQNYLTPDDVAACWNIVHNHRADTVRRAINEHEQDLHRARMEDLAKAQLDEQQRATRVAQNASVLNAIGQGAMIGAIRAEGAATRAAMSRPVRVRLK